MSSVELGIDMGMDLGLSSLSPQRQILLQNVLKLYSCLGSKQLVRDVYSDNDVSEFSFEDPLSHAIGWKQVVAQWIGLKKVFYNSSTESVKILENSESTIRFELVQKYNFNTHKSKTIKSLVILELTENDKVLIHKDLWNFKELSKWSHFFRRINAKLIKLRYYKH